MKKIVSSALCAAIVLSLIVGAAFAQGSLSNFKKESTYKDGMFTDVSPKAWYAQSVKTAYELNLMNGQGASFGSDSNIKLSEAIVMAARMHSIYNTGKADFAKSEPWYKSYVDYADANGIVSKTRFQNLEEYATRFQFAEIFAAALPNAAFAWKNNIEYGDIPDVSMETPYEHIYKLYRAGIITGKTEAGHFMPAENILRSEVAAIATRMADESLRVAFTIKKEEGGVPGGGEAITSHAALLDGIDSAHKAVLFTYNAVETAKAYFDSITGSMSPAEALALAALGNASLQKAAEYISIAAQHAKMCEDFTAGKAAYAACAERLGVAKYGCADGAKVIGKLGRSSSAAAWKEATAYVGACGTALVDAKTLAEKAA